ncbi:hypothetical protein ASPCAL14873 [Aspergillus calidoustus]|uniref:Uncharacterized protein n=1 Tax=Aspergillus calidoustus TaxID=454130 RepID=A0A0U5GH68_ASPCI|nr:hypothetical protein ASPCAL14873 [Aspergillus calidoustus]
MEPVADGQYHTQQIASDERPSTPQSDVRMSLALPGESPPSEMVLACSEGYSNNSVVPNTIQASGRRISPFHGVTSGRDIALYRDRERSSTNPGFGDPFDGEELMLHMAKMTLELLRGLSTRNAEGHVKATIGQQRRSHRLAQKARRATRWIYRSVQQIQKLGQSLDDQAELSPAMAGGPGPVWARAPRYPLRIRIPSTLALVMRFLPQGVKRSINLRDRADVARVFVALVDHWLSEAGGEGALTSRETTRQLASAEKSAKIVEAE